MNRPHITVAHADAAFKELSYLEARFRLRIDTGFSGINLDSLSSPFEEYSTVNAMNLNMQPHISKHVAHSRSTPEILRPQNTFSSLAFPSPSINPTMNGINSLLPCAHESFQQMRQNPYALPWAATNLHIDEGSNKSFANDNHLTSDKITRYIHVPQTLFLIFFLSEYLCHYFSLADTILYILVNISPQQQLNWQ